MTQDVTLLKWKFGLIRNVVLLNAPVRTANEFFEYNYLLEIPEITLMGKGEIIGLVNNTTPILYFETASPNKAYIYERMLERPLVPIASSYQTLRDILDNIAEVWSHFPDQLTLQVNEENIAKAEKILEEVHASNPSCDLSFWLAEGFAGLNIGFNLD